MSEMDWQWWAGRDEEYYTVGPEPTREAAIQVATEDFDGEPFFVVEAVSDNLLRLMRSGSQMLMEELEILASEGTFGEDGNFSLGGPPDEQLRARAELDSVFSAWAEKWRHLLPRPCEFAKTRNFAQVDPAAIYHTTGATDE